jgi:hypothetical protein
MLSNFEVILKHSLKLLSFKIPHFLNYDFKKKVGNIFLLSKFFSMKIILLYESF